MVFGRERPSGNHVVDVGMVVEGASPGMEDAEETWKIASDEALVLGEYSDGIGRRGEHGGVSGPLVGTDSGAYSLWNGEGDHEVMSW